MPTALQVITAQNNAQAAGGGLAAALAAAPVNVPSILNPPTAAPAQEPQHSEGFLQWLGDIASRPERAITNQLNAGLSTLGDAPKVAQAIKSGDSVTAGSTILGDLGNMFTSGIRGLLSTNKADQPMASDLIEKTADTAGGLSNALNPNGPQYKNVQDNVNPVIKGIGGFIGDMALDPLTYVGAGPLVKGLRTAGGLARAGATSALAGDAAGAAQSAGAALKTAGKAAADYTGVSLIGDAAKGIKNLATGAKTASDVGDQVGRIADLMKSPAPATPADPQLLSDLARSTKIVNHPDFTNLSAEAQTAALGKHGDLLQALASSGGAPADARATVNDLNSQIDAINRQDTSQLPIEQQNALGQHYNNLVQQRDALVGAPSQLALEAPKVTVDSRGGALRTGQEAPPFEPGVSAAGIQNRPLGSDFTSTPLIDTSKVAATDPVVNGTSPMLSVAGHLASEVQAQAHADALGALPSYITDHFNLKNYDHAVSATARATKADGTGVAKITNQLGTNAQFTLMRKLGAPIFKDLGEQGLKGMQRANAFFQRLLPAQQLTEALLDAKGATTTLDFQGERRFLSMGQLLHVMDTHSAASSKALRLALGNKSTEVGPSILGEAAVAAMRNTPDAAAQALERLTTSAGGRTKQGVEIPNYLAGGKNVPVPGAGTITSKKMTAALLDALTGPGQQEKLLAVERANYAAREARFGTEKLEMTAEMQRDIQTLVNDPTKLGDALTAINGIPTRAATIGKRAETDPVSAAAATDETTATLARIHPGAAEAASYGINAMNAAARGDRAGVQTAVRDLSKSATKDADARAAEAAQTPMTPEQTPSISDNPELTAHVRNDVVRSWKARDKGFRDVQSTLMRFLDPIAKIFRSDYGMEGTSLYQIQNGLDQVKEMALGDKISKINPLAAPMAQQYVEGRTFGDEVGRLWLTGQRSNDPQVQGLLDAAHGVLDDILPTLENNHTGLLGSIFERTGSSVDWVAARMGDTAHYPGLEGVSIDVGRAADDAARLGITPLKAMMLQASDWHIPDFPQFMMSMSAMWLRAGTEAAIATQAQQHLIESGLAALERTGGMAKAMWNDGSVLAPFMSKDLRLSPQGVRAVEALQGLVSPKARNGIETYMREFWDPATKIWKFGMTLPRPGYFVKNGLSDAIMTYFGEGLRGSKAAGRTTAKLLMNRSPLAEWDPVEFLSAMGVHDYKGGGEKLYSLTVGGAKTDVTNDDIWKIMREKGLLTDYSTAQGLNALNDSGKLEKPSGVQGLADKVTNNALSAKLVHASEWTGWTFRINQFTQILHKFETDGFVLGHLDEKIVPKNIEDLMTIAAERVRRYHPDTTTLARPEKQVIRRTFPFYSWIRGALPAVIGTTLMHPGRVLAFPKASYNIAVANGVHPDSLSDPFPMDQVFPSYLAGNALGPQFKDPGGNYWNLNPGIPSVDVANDLNPANIGSTVGSLVTPALAIPFQAATGTSLGAGEPVKDWSDYVDEQLPGSVGVLAQRTAGTSLSGTIAARLLTGNPNAIDRTANYRAGNMPPDAYPLAGILGYLTGATPTNESQKNYQEAGLQDATKLQLRPGQATPF